MYEFKDAKYCLNVFIFVCRAYSCLEYIPVFIRITQVIVIHYKSVILS